MLNDTMTIEYANEVFDNLMAGPELDSTVDGRAYDLDIALPVVKNWLLEKMNDNYLRWLGGMITDTEYKDTMLEYSDLATMIIDNSDFIQSGHYWRQSWPGPTKPLNWGFLGESIGQAVIPKMAGKYKDIK